MSPFPASITEKLDRVERRVLIHIMWGRSEQTVDLLGKRRFNAAAKSVLAKLGCSDRDEAKLLVARLARLEIQDSLQRYHEARQAREVRESLFWGKRSRLLAN